MPNLAIAFVLCGIAAVICYLVLLSMGHGSEAFQVSSAILGFVPKIRQELDKYQAKRSGFAAPTIDSLGDYDVHAGRAIVYATVIGLAAVNLANLAGYAIAGAIARRTPLSGQTMLENQTCIAMPIALSWALPVLFVIGCWIGQRCVKHGAVIALISAFVIRLATLMVDSTMWRLETPCAWLGIDNGAGAAESRVFFGTLIFFGVMMLGVVVGKRQRLPKYFSYLLKQLTPSSRLAIVELAYAETLEKTRSARSLSRPKKRPAASPPAPEAYVLGLSGSYSGTRIPVQSELVFGRDAKQCSVVFPASQDGISSRHCTLIFDGTSGTYLLRDLNSSNGTFVNGQKLQPLTPRLLRDGDEFYLHTPDNLFALGLGPLP